MMGGGELPEGWVAATLEAVAEVHDNLREPVNSTERKGRVGPFSYYGATGQVGWIDDFRQDGEYILLGEDGAPFFDPTKDKADWVSGKCWVNNHAHVLKGRDGVCLNRYLLYALNQVNYRGFANGTTRLKLTQAAMRQLPINLAPLAEQHRIVAKIEELFSELDQGVASLKAVREQLKVYRQSLLNNAFEGKLTAAWRAAHADQFETAEALQQRIATERQTRHQQQLADWQTTGPQGPKPKPPKPLPPLTAEDLADLPELPAGWGWVSVSQLLAEELCNGKSVKDRKGGFPVLRLNALGDGKIDLSIQKEGAWTATEAKNYVVEVGDFLVSRGNGSKHLVGRGGFVSTLNGMFVAFPDTMIRIRLLRRFVDFRYFGLCWDSMLVRSQIENTARTTAGLYKINQELIEAYKVPLPTALEEQQLIVQELESKLSEADQLDQTLAAALQRADALRQAILKKAFCGQLVAQDANDEPAAVLLERVRAERSACSAKSRQTKLGSKSLPNC